jgi:hypothetical protein
MVREDLVSLCENYVRSRDEAASQRPVQSADPAPEIVRSFRLAEISESEMQALLAYVDDSDDQEDFLADEMEAAGISLHVYNGLEAQTTDDDDDETAWQPDQPR